MIEKKSLVMIVMPCLNEEAYIGKALRIKALIRLLDNRDRIASCGMNLGIAQAAGFLFRLVKW
jgi:glycosyltransferase involved in cell wall biosynthesis